MLIGFAIPVWGQEAPRAHSTTGPVPPAGLVSQPLEPTKATKTISGVPAYLWRHGCGPTALGMVVGYFDANGYPDLIPGDASTQTSAVNQAIASGGSASNPMISEQHYEDYARPQTYGLPDDYITMGRTPHADNSVADFAKTSRSTEDNNYGWTWSNHMKPGFENYVNYAPQGYQATSTVYYWPGVWNPELTFDIVKTEIDNNRPMVVLVDSTGNGYTDHFVPIIGYDDGPPQKYIFFDTWSTTPQQAEFRGITLEVPGTPYGIWGAWTFVLDPTLHFTQTPTGARKKIGDPLTLQVGVAGAVGEMEYQWLKDAAMLPGETTDIYFVASLTPADAGWYSCRASDESETQIETDTVFINVLPAGDLPITGMAGLSAMLLAFVASGAFVHHRRRRA